MNRQPRGQRLVRNTIHLDAGLLAELDRVAADQGLSRSGMIAQIVRKALKLEPARDAA